MKYDVIILDDDIQQHRYLSTLLLKEFPDFRVVGIGSTIEEGRALLDSFKPDLAFLDVVLPPSSIFDLLNSMESISFEIIFTTSYEEYAVKAFRLSAIDYLLKPFDVVDLRVAIQKFVRARSMQNTDSLVKNLLGNLRDKHQRIPKIALPTLTGFIFVPVDNIIRCESDNTYTTFFTKDKRKIVVSKTLKDCEKMLAEFGFFRVHNSHLINLEYITEYTKGEGGVIVMSDGSNVDVSRRRKEEFLMKLKKN